MKPQSFFDLPWTLQEELLWEIDGLKFCSYESSRADCINNMSNGLLSKLNERIIINFYKTVSAERLQIMAKQTKYDLLSQISTLDKIIN